MPRTVRTVSLPPAIQPDMRFRFLLRPPTTPGRTFRLPHLAEVPQAVGRQLPNGMVIVVDEAAPEHLYKFVPWEKAALAFNEVLMYSSLEALGDPSGIVRLLGVSGTSRHFVRQVERADLGPLDGFLLGRASADPQPLPAVSVRSLLAQVAETMAAIHALGLVHRDLKAENVLVFDAKGGAGDDVRLKVSDFDRSIELPPGARLKAPVGSLFHMAPELLAWEPYDRKVDVYAFGILMYEVAHGGLRPHRNVGTFMPDSMSRHDFARKVVEEDLRPPWRHEDAALARLAARCWAKHPAERPDFDELLDLLRQGTPVAGEAPVPRRAPPDPGETAGVGIASDVGRARTTMEDAACVLLAPGALVACVFDGLRGAGASELAARQLALCVLDGLKERPDADVALRAAFAAVESTLQRVDGAPASGSTAVVALLREHDLTVAWLGDSPAWIFRKDLATGAVHASALIDPQHPGRSDEAARVQANGGSVGREQRWLDNGEAVPTGPLRVFVPGQASGVALSRALGLFAYKPALGNEPQTLSVEREPGDCFLVLGSDGVFDLLDPQEVLRIVAGSASAQAGADAVIAAVLERGAPDNASAVVIDLRRVGL